MDLAGARRLPQWGAGQNTNGGTAGAHGDVQWPFTDRCMVTYFTRVNQTLSNSLL